MELLHIFHTKKKRTAKDLNRRSARKSPYSTILIVCEGEKTEVKYFKEFIKFHRLNTANVKVLSSKKGSAPINVIEFAIETAESQEGIYKVYCVWDRDNHESYERALDKIKNHKSKRKAKSKPRYQAIVSLPCFEIWLLLHFTFTSKPYTPTEKHSPCDNVIIDLRQYLSHYAKNSNDLYEQLSEHTEVAIQNGDRLKEYNLQSNSSNPATDVHELIRDLKSLTT